MLGAPRRSPYPLAKFLSEALQSTTVDRTQFVPVNSVRFARLSDERVVIVCGWQCRYVNHATPICTCVALVSGHSLCTTQLQSSSQKLFYIMFYRLCYKSYAIIAIIFCLSCGHALLDKRCSLMLMSDSQGIFLMLFALLYLEFRCHSRIARLFN